MPNSITSTTPLTKAPPEGGAKKLRTSQILKAAQAIVKDEEVAAQGLTEARQKAEAALIEADAEQGRVRDAWQEACSAVRLSERKVRSAEALERLCKSPRLVEVLIGERDPSLSDQRGLVARKLMRQSDGWRGPVYSPTALGEDVAKLLHELRSKLSSEDKS